MPSNTDQLELPGMSENFEFNKNVLLLDELIHSVARFQGIKATKIDIGVWKLEVVSENPDEKV